MKIFIIFLAAIFLSLSCQTASSKVSAPIANQTANNSAVIENSSEVSSIRKIDFQNFTFSWTKKFGSGEKTFALKNGVVDLPDERKVSFYCEVTMSTKGKTSKFYSFINYQFQKRGDVWKITKIENQIVR